MVVLTWVSKEGNSFGLTLKPKQLSGHSVLYLNKTFCCQMDNDQFDKECFFFSINLFLEEKEKQISTVIF